MHGVSGHSPLGVNCKAKEAAQPDGTTATPRSQTIKVVAHARKSSAEAEQNWCIGRFPSATKGH